MPQIKYNKLFYHLYCLFTIQYLLHFGNCIISSDFDILVIYVINIIWSLL